MTDEKWESAYALFHEASRLPPGHRRTFVENASGDPEITVRVLELLDDADAGEHPVARAGTRIGRYVVIDRLGRGGMGEVYSDDERFEFAEGRSARPRATCSRWY